MTDLTCFACSTSSTPTLLEPDDRFCPSCGQTTARILWSSSSDARPGQNIAPLPLKDEVYIVAHNAGNHDAQVWIDTKRLRGLRVVGGDSPRTVAARQWTAFALQSLPDDEPGGFLLLCSDDALRPHPSLDAPDSPWWKRQGSRSDRHFAREFARVAVNRWIVGSPNLLFPPDVRRQAARVWNDAEETRAFESDVPAGYQVTTRYHVPIERDPPEIQPFLSSELMVAALPERGAKSAETEWLAGPDATPIPLHRLAAPAGDAGADVVVAIDFGTRNTGVRVRWRRKLYDAKPKGHMDIIGDRDGNDRFPTEMILHRRRGVVHWGSDAPKGILGPDEFRINNLKTLLRVNEEPYRRDNLNWTNAYLLELYFEQLFIRIDDYFKSVDPSLSRRKLNIRYIMSRPVLDANEGDAQGKAYERALTIALERCNVTAGQITFVFEPVAAAYGIAGRRQQELLALEEGTAIAVIDAGGGTTDIALAHVSLRDGRPSLKIRSTYALRLDAANPALEALKYFDKSDRQEFGGDTLDVALTYRLLTDTSGLLLTEGRAVPPRLEFSPLPPTPEDRKRSEAELVPSVRRMKEAFAHVSTHYLTPSVDHPQQEHEHSIFANRPDYEGIHLEQENFGENLVAPLLAVPVQELRERMEENGFQSGGIRPSQVRQVFYVGGTNIESYVREQFQFAFPAAPRLLAETSVDVRERISERLNVVVEGAALCDESLFVASSLTLTLTLKEAATTLLEEGEPLPPEADALLHPPFPVRLEPYESLEARLTAMGSGLAEPMVVARGFYRNDSDATQEGALQLRMNQERAVTATLHINGHEYDQWRFILTEAS